MNTAVVELRVTVIVSMTGGALLLLDSEKVPRKLKLVEEKGGTLIDPDTEDEELPNAEASEDDLAGVDELERKLLRPKPDELTPVGQVYGGGTYPLGYGGKLETDAASFAA